VPHHPSISDLIIPGRIDLSAASHTNGHRRGVAQWTFTSAWMSPLLTLSASGSFPP
jgi:hypothetical protein